MGDSWELIAEARRSPISNSLTEALADALAEALNELEALRGTMREDPRGTWFSEITDRL